MKSKTATTLSDDIVFINRPFPPENVDLITYVEDQIVDLLSENESLSDVLYRYEEGGDELVISLAWKKTLELHPVSFTSLCYRIPSAIDLWCKAKGAFKKSETAFIYSSQQNFMFLLFADAQRVYRIFRFGKGNNIEGDASLFIDRIKEKYPLCKIASVYTLGTVPDAIKTAALKHSLALIPGLPTHAPRAAYEQWDFRLEHEIEKQDLGIQKAKVYQSGLLTIAGLAAVWLLLFGTGTLLEHMESKSRAQWHSLQKSLKDITFFQKQTRLLVSEIMLCQKLSEKRTNKAILLEQISVGCPDNVNLIDLLIGEDEQKATRKKGSVLPSREIVILKAASSSGTSVTEWMDNLSKNRLFSTVKLLSMIKKNNQYLFQVECTILK